MVKKVLPQETSDEAQHGHIVQLKHVKHVKVWTILLSTDSLVNVPNPPRCQYCEYLNKHLVGTMSCQCLSFLYEVGFRFEA